MSGNKNKTDKSSVSSSNVTSSAVEMASENKGGASTNTKTDKKETTVTVEFEKSPTGQFGLAYNAGDKAKVSKEQADILIENGCAKKV